MTDTRSGAVTHRSVVARSSLVSTVRGIKGATGIHEDDDPGGKAHKKLDDDPPYADEYNNPKDHRSKH